MRNMAEGGYNPEIPRDGEGESNQGYDYDDYDDGGIFSTKEEWNRFTPEQRREKWGRSQGYGKEWDKYHEDKRKYEADKYKPAVSKKTYERWKSQEEEEPLDEKEKTQSSYDREDYDRWAREEEQEKRKYKFFEKKPKPAPKEVEVPMKERGVFYARPQDAPGYIKKTSTSKEEEETLFGGTPTIEEKMQERERVSEEILKVFPNIDRKYLPLIKFDMFDRLVYKGDKTWKDGVDRNKTYVIAENGRPSYDYTLKSKLPEGLKKALGKSNLQINDENIERQRIEEEYQAKREQELENLERRRAELQSERESSRERLEEYGNELEECEKILQGHPTVQEAEEVRKRIPQIKNGMRVEGGKIRTNEQETEVLKQNITKQEEDVNVGEQQVETARERVNQRLLSLRDRIREIFKKHGFTVVAVASAIGVVIGVIVKQKE